MMKHVTVIGGGVLGTQIGLMGAYTGHHVTFWLRSESSIGRTQPKLERYKKMMIDELERSKQLIGNPLAAAYFPKGLIPDPANITVAKIDASIETARQRFEEQIEITLDLAEAVKEADIVIEAMSEDPAQKKQIYERLKAVMPAKTILCTNSSTLLPSQFAEATGRPEKYLSMHFANQIWRFNTAEIMKHEKTDEAVFNTVIQFAEELNMVPIPIYKEQPGYVLNSLLVPYLSAAQQLWAAGIADPEKIDQTWKIGTGAPKGPFEIIDVVGLETVYNIAKRQPQAETEGTIPNQITKLLKEKIEKGETGIHAGKGFYTYE